MAKKCTIKQGDTLQYISLGEYGTSSNWMRIADYNNLDFPFIDTSDSTEYAIGYELFYRNPSVTGDISIPFGTQVSVEDGSKVFQTTVSSKIAAGHDYVEIRVQAVSPGISYEIPRAGMVTKLVDVPLRASIFTVTNKFPLSVLPLLEFATGKVTFYRKDGVVGDISIPVGTLIGTTYNPETKTIQRVFVTEQSVIMLAGVNSIEVSVRCTIPGSVGNVSQGVINQLLSSITDIDGNAQIGRVINALAFMNGATKNIKKIGDTLLLPGIADKRVVSGDLFLELYGSDLKLSEEGDLVVGRSGDASIVSGLDNVVQAVDMRLRTPVGSLYAHPTYGNLFDSYIAFPGTREKLNIILDEVSRCIKADPRIEDVYNLQAVYSNRASAINANIKLKKSAKIEDMLFLGSGGTNV